MFVWVKEVLIIYKSVLQILAKVPDRQTQEHQLRSIPTQKNFVRDMDMCSTTLYQTRKYIFALCLTFKIGVRLRSIKENIIPRFSHTITFL